MSAETAEWLNTMTLQGYTGKRGTAWHYLESAQGAEPNHYDGAIPVEDVKRRLFSWEPVAGVIKTTARVGGRSVTQVVPNLKSWVHPATGDVLGVVGKGATSHGYSQWLVDNTREALDTDELGIGSAGLLQKGAKAWVQIELADTIEGPGGVFHRPFYTATTVLDGSMSTTYQTGTRLVVCDNTLAGALSERGIDRIKYPHRAGTTFNPREVRDGLGILYANADEINAELDELLNTPVSDAQWDAFLTAHIGERPRPLIEGKASAAITKWDDRHDALTNLYRTDPRVKEWTGTAFGVIQAVNTFNTHQRVVKGMSRPERNMFNMATGATQKEDAQTLERLQLVLAA